MNDKIKIDDYGTLNYEDAIRKSSNHYINNSNVNIDYITWCKLVKSILDVEAKYDRGFKPSAEQYRAILTQARRTLIDACPGSGKTATLIFKIFIDGAIFKHPIGSQLALTYTNAAATEMEDRYVKLCNKYGTSPNARLSTIHSFAKSIETSLSYKDVLEPDGMNVLVKAENEDDNDSWSLEDELDGDDFDMFGSDEDQYQEVFISDRNFISEAIDQLGLPYTYVSNISQIGGWISTIVEKDINTEEEFKQIVEFSSLEGIYLQDLLNIHKLTKEYRDKYNVMNFTDMLVGLYERLRRTETLDDIANPLIRKNLRLNVIYVDEYQDISPLQFKIIKELLRLNPDAKLFAVGDADQAIYSFRGSYTGFLTKFKEYFTSEMDWREDLYGNIKEHKIENKGFNLINWKEEYKSPNDDKYEGKTEKNQLKEYIKDYLEENKSKEDEKEEENDIKSEITEPDSKEEDIDIIYFTINRRSGKEIIEFSNNLIEKNVYRYPKEMKPVESKDSYIEINKEHKESDITNKIVERIEDLMKAGVEDFSQHAIIYREHRQALQIIVKLAAIGIPIKIRRDILPCNYTELNDIFGIFMLIYNSSNPLIVEQYLYKVCASVNKNKAKFIADNMRSHGGPFSKYLPNTKAAMNDVNRLRKIYIDAEKDINNAIELIIEAYLKHFRNFFSKDNHRVMAVQEYLKLIDAKDYNDLRNKHDTIKRVMNNNSNMRYGITMSTMHAAKGLEFDTIYLLPPNDSYMHKKSIISKMMNISEKYVEEYVEEERRLLFVAITRAKKNLIIMLDNTTDLYPSELISSLPK